MNKIRALFPVWIMVWLLTIQTAWADCILPYENPFDQAQNVYLVEVVTVQKPEKNNHGTSAQVRVLKIYKAKDIELVKQLNVLSSYQRWGQPEQFERRKQYLLYDNPVLSSCNVFGNKQVSQDEIQLFEQQHKPVWVEK